MIASRHNRLVETRSSWFEGFTFGEKGLKERSLFEGLTGF